MPCWDGVYPKLAGPLRFCDRTRGLTKVSCIVQCLGSFRIFIAAATQLRYLAIGIKVLVSIAIIGTILLGAVGDREAWVDGCVLVRCGCVKGTQRCGFRLTFRGPLQVAIFLAVEQLETWYT